jgi:hypothetical protein
MDHLIKIFGKLTDFDGNAIADGEVVIKDALFKDVYRTTTDECGKYVLEVEKRSYMAIAAVKDYVINKLEYWGWNLPAFQDTEINIRIDGLEVYAINAFMIQRSHPYTSMMIYFRPMSLKRYLMNKDKLNDSNEVLIDLSPKLNEEDMEIKINEKPVNILGMNRIIEKAVDSPHELYGYIVQVAIPENVHSQGYMKIQIALNDHETGERGEGSLFWHKPESFDYINN